MLMEILTPLTQFGVAGLMGALWVWERMLSRRREAQLNAAHERIVQQKHELHVLMRMMRRNTQTIERFEQTQDQLYKLLERIHHEMPRKAA